MFDPFVTTARGKGSKGLGLNLVYNLVTQGLKGISNATSLLREAVDLGYPSLLLTSRSDTTNQSHYQSFYSIY
ncbi:hypothetical protein [Vibrio mexicanus]|uniref:hypothetical protein n=1 Tax=Vibrio mexicanus TaxID=1004326 RepID=UPI001EE2A801|nr:hypothetical protein [Vibrio mexicanus]